MISIGINPTIKNRLKILLLGAHCDDIEIGCGGSILKLSQTVKELEVYWVVMSSDRKRKQEASSCAESFLKNVPKKRVIINTFKNGYFPYIGGSIKDYFEGLKDAFNPDLIFTHCGKDFHQDHRVVSELTWNTFRNHLILEYEIPKYDGDMSSPNFYIHLNESICRNKVDYLMNYYVTQRDKQWFSENLFFSILRMRGMESNSPSKYAEGFYCRKIVY